MRQDPRIGTEVAGYRIEAPLGRGGVSVVYLAEDVRLGRKVALKLLSPQLAENREFRERFLRESRIAASIDHPNIVPVYEAGEEDGILYISMRYVQGTDLGATIAAEGPLDLPRTVHVLSQVAAALDVAHTRELVHRDVKPGNILLDRRSAANEVDHAYLADFGLTKRALSGSGFTATGQMVGTIDYVAPEQIRGDPVDGRADVYSLGCVVFECLTGHVPFPRDREIAVLWAHVQDPVPSVTQERADAPPGADHVVARAMAKDRQDRYPTASALVDDLRSELVPEALRRSRRPFVPAARRRHTRRVVGGVIATAVVATAIGLFIAFRPAPAVIPAGNSLSRIDAARHAFVETRPAGEGPIGVAVGEGSVWVVSQGESTVKRYDAEDLTADPAQRAVQGNPTGVAVGEGAAWVTTLFRAAEGGGLYRMNLNTNDLTPLAGGPPGAQAVEVGDAAVWVAVANADEIWRIDPLTGEAGTGDRFGMGADAGPVALAVGSGETSGVWVANDLGRSLVRIPAREGAIDTISLPSAPSDVAVDAASVWVASEAADSVYRIDPGSGEVFATVRVPDGPVALAVGADGVWVCSYLAGVVARIDPRTNLIVDRLSVQGGPEEIAADDQGDLWVVVRTR